MIKHTVFLIVSVIVAFFLVATFGLPFLPALAGVFVVLAFVGRDS